MVKKPQVRFMDAVGPTLISATIVPKSRKPKFELTLKIIDLNNVPLVSGTAFIKWHLPHSTAAEHRGKTTRAAIKDHKVTWDYKNVTQLRVTADKTGLLQATDIALEIVQEYSSGARGERIALGTLKLNLAEYVEGSYDCKDGVTRRYLMKDSKINSTVKLSISMKQIEGDRVFTAPPLKSAPIFGGIAGVVFSEQVADQEDGCLASISSKNTHDLSEMQDMYRQTLNASLCSQIYELPADQCIEDIFSGGDGWGNKPTTITIEAPSPRPDCEDGESENERIPPSGEQRRGISQPAHQRKSRPHHHRRKSSRQEIRGFGKSRSKSTEAQMHSSSSDDHLNWQQDCRTGVSEFDLRDDLRSWKLPSG